MRQFVWRLQKVLDIKEKEEQVKRTELFQLTEKLAETQGRLLDRRRILRDIILEVANIKPEKRLGKQEFLLKNSAATDEQIKNLENEVSELQSSQKKKVTEVLKAKKFKEGLEKLRHEAKRRFITQQEKLEQKELDEGTTISFGRNRNALLQ
jgi:flagellar FliJ protein